jgi:flagellar hook-length control protein FliK
MITPSLAIPVQPAAAGQAAGATAAEDSAAGTGVDFATLIGAGIRLTPGVTELGDHVTVAKKVAGSDDDKDAAALDPLALLEAIASGQITLDPKATAAAVAAAAATTPTQGPVHHGVVPLSAKTSDDARVAPQTGAIAPRVAHETVATAKATANANATRNLPQADTQNSKDASRDQRSAGDDSALPVTTTAASTQAIQTQAASAVAAKIELPEHAVETALTTTATASAQSLAAPTPAANRDMTAAVTQLERLSQPLGTSDWKDGLANRVVWMAKNDVQTASIQLNPPNLGPVEVRVTIVSDPGSPTSATVQFSAAHSATRDAIESSMPRLHEALRESGITLGNASVDSGNAGHARNQADSSGRQSSGNGTRGDGGESLANATSQPRSTPLVRGGTGLVDTFA